MTDHPATGGSFNLDPETGKLLPRSDDDAPAIPAEPEAAPPAPQKKAAK